MSTTRIIGVSPHRPDDVVADEQAAEVDAAGESADARAQAVHAAAEAVRRADEIVFTDADGLAALRRTPEKLLAWLFQALEFPVGVVLLTRTSIVPPPEVTRADGDAVRIAVAGISTLVSPVTVVGTARPRMSGKAHR